MVILPKESNGDTSKEEQIGFHKGALTTLAKERQELLKMVNVVEQIMQMHVKALRNLGIDLTKQATANSNKPKKGKAIDEIIEK